MTGLGNRNKDRSFMKAFNPVPNSRQNRTVDGGVPCANAKKSNQTLVMYFFPS